LALANPSTKGANAVQNFLQRVSDVEYIGCRACAMLAVKIG